MASRKAHTSGESATAGDARCLQVGVKVVHPLRHVRRLL